jgi:hypothetical protein
MATGDTASDPFVAEQPERLRRSKRRSANAGDAESDA